MTEYNQKDHIQQQKDRTRKIKDNIKAGKMPKGKKKEKQEPDKIIQSPAAIRNELAQEYNRLIREGDPETKELREQIHDQIQKLEKTDA